jgi:polyisoprenyl-teichoic acid--peptidoglycan teichoic acid transferase
MKDRKPTNGEENGSDLHDGDREPKKPGNLITRLFKKQDIHSIQDGEPIQTDAEKGSRGIRARLYKFIGIRKAIKASTDEIPVEPAEEKTDTTADTPPAREEMPGGQTGQEPDAERDTIPVMDEIPVEQTGQEAAPAVKEKLPGHFHIGGWQYSIKRLILVSIAILLAVGIGLGGQFSYVVFASPQSAFGMPTPIPQETQTLIPTTTGTNSAAPTPTPDPYATVSAQAAADFSKDIVNVLLIGADYAEERADWHRYNSDVMIVLAMNFAQNKADLISVPRDSYAKIYKTTGHYKLNSSLYFGGGFEKDGPEYVMRSVETVLGNKIPINYYIGVDIPGLKDIVDALGGVDYNVDVRIDLNGRIIEPGQQHLSGQQVVDYCRARKGIDNDLGRVDRQKDILLALFQQMRNSKSLAKVPDLLSAMQGRIHTNLSFQQICAMVMFGSGLSDDKIKLHTVEGKFALIFNSKFVVLDQQAKVELVKEVYNADIKADNAYGYASATREWQKMMTQQYIAKVQKVLNGAGGAKIPEEKKAVLNADIAEAQAAVSSRKTSRMDGAKNRLQADMDQTAKECGLSAVNWDVDQNPGKKAKY